MVSRKEGPVSHGADGSRLSKRHGAVSVLAYRDAGYLPEAVLNYIVRLGWSHGDQEIFSVNDLVNSFDLDHVNHSAASFDPEKFLRQNAAAAGKRFRCRYAVSFEVMAI